MTIKIAASSVEVPVFVDALQKEISLSFFVLTEEVVAHMWDYIFFVVLHSFLDKERGLSWHWNEMIEKISADNPRNKDVVIIFPWEEETESALDELIKNTPYVSKISIGFGKDHICSYNEKTRDIQRAGHYQFDYVPRESIVVIGEMKY